MARAKRNSEKTYVLGVEGGGTKTEWVFLRVDSKGRHVLIKSGLLSSANLRLISDASLRNLFRLLPVSANSVGVYLAGCVTEADRHRLREITRKIWRSACLRVGSDRESALATAFGNRDGIAVMSGTGSAVTGRKGDRIENAGGRGHLLGDRGGGYVISIEGLRLALRTYDLEHRVSPLAESILRALSLNRMEDLIGWTQSAEKKEISALVPVMFECAEQGETEMLELIRSSAQVLAQYTQSVARWLAFENPPVRLMGSLFLHEPLYVDLYRQALNRILKASSVSVCRKSGAWGAAFLAMQSASNDQTSVLQSSKIVADKTPARLQNSGPQTEKANRLSKGIDRFSLPKLIGLFINEENAIQSALAGAQESFEKAVRMVVESMRGGGRLFYVGAGTSGRLGILDASEIPPTFGEPAWRVQAIIAGGQAAITNSVEGAEDNELHGIQSIRQRGVRKGDVVCGITASGTTPFVLAALREANEIGARTMLITCNPDAAGARISTCSIVLSTGPELIAGSTRLKCGSATKTALNILSTCAMIRLGKVRGNQMVDMKPLNKKLKIRAIRIVSELRRWSADRAERELRKHKWNIRRALSNG